MVSADEVPFCFAGFDVVLRDSTTLALQRLEREPSTPSALGLLRGKADTDLWHAARQRLTPKTDAA
jgi:hypothetical protein